MDRTRLVLSAVAIAAAIAMSGCDPQPSSETSTTSSEPAASASAPATTATKDAADAAATAKACKELKKDIKDNATKVAKAEKIGPPAGHIAVSAQWTAGSTAILAHSIGTPAAVSAAADKVQAEMMALGDAYNKSASAKPSKKKLDAAIDDLNAACAAA